MAKAEKRLKNIKSVELHICPICNSKNINKVELNEYYCMDCCIEIRDGKPFTIQYSGELISYYVNEFMDCG